MIYTFTKETEDVCIECGTKTKLIGFHFGTSEFKKLELCPTCANNLRRNLSCELSVHHGIKA